MATINPKYAKFLPPCCMRVRLPLSSLWKSYQTNQYVQCDKRPLRKNQTCLQKAKKWCSYSKGRFMSPQCQGYVNSRNINEFAGLYRSYCNYADLANTNSPCRKAVKRYGGIFDKSINNYCKKTNQPYRNDLLCSCYAARQYYGNNLSCNGECTRYGYKNKNTLSSIKNQPCNHNMCVKFPQYTRNLVFPRRNSPLVMSAKLNKYCNTNNNSPFMNITPKRDQSYKTTIGPFINY